jgi:aminoglycoside phosphotransferase (APT) family kinase protein
VVREADALRRLQERHPSIDGAPRVLAEDRRAGTPALAETAIHGTPLMSALTADSFPRLAGEVTGWLTALAGASPPIPRANWWDRLVAQPLNALGRDFGAALYPGELAAISSALECLPELPTVFEHRDCSPWNVILTTAGRPALLDWESAEPRGLPLLDLVYFLTNAAFVLQDALESGATRECYSSVLDPGTATGSVAAGCIARYCDAVGLDPCAVPPLRLLTWVVHTGSDFEAFKRGAVEPHDQRTLNSSVFLGLVREELSRSRG